MTDKKTLYEYFTAGTQDPEKIKLVFYNNRIDAKSLMRDVDAIAAYLKKIGVKEGDSVGISMPNTPHAIAATYAVSKIGGIVNAIHPLIKTKGLMKALAICGSKIVFVLDRFYAQHETALKEAGIKAVVCHISDYLKTPLKQAFRFTEKHKFSVGDDYKNVRKTKGNTKTVTNIGERAAVYLHSGGTTGEPKTVSLSANAVNTLADNIIDSGCNGEYDDRDSMLMVLPLFHGFGFVISMHTVIAHGRLVLMPSFDAKRAVKLIKSEKISMLAGVPAMYRKMMDRPEFDGKYLKSLKFIFCGGDKLTSSFQDEFNAVLEKNGSTARLQEGYGLTEVVSVVSVNRKNNINKGSVGQAIAETEIRILDEEGKEVPLGEKGEIVVSNPSVMLEYLGDAEATAKCKIELDGKTFVRTGDIGTLDKDGFLYFKDRMKRVVKVSGFNIFPSEVENIVSNLPEVKYATVVPIRYDGKPATKLYVVVNEGIVYDARLEARIKRKIEEETMKYAVPRVIECVKELKLTETGKVDFKYYVQKEREAQQSDD